MMTNIEAMEIFKNKEEKYYQKKCNLVDTKDGVNDDSSFLGLNLKYKYLIQQRLDDRDDMRIIESGKVIS